MNASPKRAPGFHEGIVSKLQAAGATAEGVILVGICRPARQVNRIFKLIFARLARPHVANAMVRQMLSPFRSDDIRATLGALPQLPRQIFGRRITHLGQGYKCDPASIRPHAVGRYAPSVAVQQPSISKAHDRAANKFKTRTRLLHPRHHTEVTVAEVRRTRLLHRGDDLAFQSLL